MASAASASAAQATSTDKGQTPFDPDQNWESALGFVSEDWEGYVGTWSRLAAEDGASPKVLKQYKGLRCFRNVGDGHFEHVNVYSTDTGGCDQREDGNFGKQWTYNKAEHAKEDGWWHPFMPLEGNLRSRVVSLPGCTTSVMYGLPLAELKADGHPVPPFFAGEFFLRAPNEERSWSGSPMYSTETGQLVMMYYIQERRIKHNPHEAVDHDALGIPEAREPLPTDPSQWLQGKWTGKRQQIRWEPDGRMMNVWEVPITSFEPPRSDDAYNLSLLPDSIYFSYPKQLPTAQADVPAEGIRIQMGGFTKLDGSVFRRQLTHYSTSGKIDSVTYEEWRKQV